MKTSNAAVLLLLFGCMQCTAVRNVLLVIADDLRPELNAAYDSPHMVTPSLDLFASTATVFESAYCNFAICSPSRNSFMTGRSPDTTRVWNFLQDFRHAGAGTTGLNGSDWVTLPEYFKDHGYLTLGHGKTYHPNKPLNWDEPHSWSQDQAYGLQYISNCESNQLGERYCPSEGPADKFSDYNTTKQAIDTLGTMVAQSKPWFLAVGLHNPHQPWNTPVEIAWQYAAATAMAPPKYPYSPIGMPDVAFTAELDGNIALMMNFSKPTLQNRTQDPGLPSNVTGVVSFPCPSPGNNTVPEWFSQYMRLGYRTAVTATDTHVGMLLAALDAAGHGVADNTLVVFLGDHGWQLGEHTEYGKHTNFDLAVHVPLMIRAPWKPKSAGQRAKTSIELLDLYRTMASLAGLPSPPDDVEGDDMSAALDTPGTVTKSEAYAQYSRCPGGTFFPVVTPNPFDWELNNCENVPPQNISFMGYTLKTPEFRFTEWYSWDGSACVARFDSPPRGTELYNHTGVLIVGDFDSAENVNIAALPANGPLVTQMRTKLWSRFKRAAPGTGCPPSEDPLGRPLVPSLEWPHA